MRARSLKFCMHLESGQVYCGKENQDAEIYVWHLFPFFPSLSPMLYRYTHKNFVIIKRPAKLTFGTHLNNMFMSCVYKNQAAGAYSSCAGLLLL